MPTDDPASPAERLRRHGLQVTAQRLAVLRAVGDRPHGTADDIEAQVRVDIGAVSRQAVYDALGILSDRGLIRRIQPARSPARYEGRVDDNHHHLVCRACGATVDVDCAIGERPCLQATQDHGFLALALQELALMTGRRSEGDAKPSDAPPNRWTTSSSPSAVQIRLRTP